MDQFLAQSLCYCSQQSFYTYGCKKISIEIFHRNCFSVSVVYSVATWQHKAACEVAIATQQCKAACEVTTIALTVVQLLCCCVDENKFIFVLFPCLSLNI